MPDTSPAISVRNLRKVYDNRAAVDGLTLTVPRGCFFGFLGPNGAGKTTTIKMLMGLAPPTEGTIELLGLPMPEKSLAIKQLIGLVPDETLLFDHLTGGEFIEFAGRIYGLDRTVARERSVELLRLFELSGDGKKLIAEYSKGMRKRVAMAAALIHRPQLFLMDEPFEGVDAMGARLMKDILLEQVRHGATIFLTSHVLEVVERLCDRVAIIDHGKLLREGSMAELRGSAETLEDAFVEALGMDRSVETWIGYRGLALDVMTHTRAIVWAQWRTLRNMYPRMGIAWTAIVGVIWYSFWAGLSIAISLIIARPDNPGLVAVILPGLLLLVFLYWQLVPLLMTASGASLELRKLQVYPIPEVQLFGAEVVLRVTAALEVFLALTGAAVGVIRNPSLAAWGTLALIPYIVFNLLLGVGLRDAITRVLARRRIREAAFFLLILCAALPQMLLTRGGRFRGRIAQQFLREAWAGWPWTAVARLLQGQDVLRSAAVLTGWCLGAAAFSYWQFRRTLAFDAQAAGARRSGGSSEGGWVDRLHRLPSMVLADPLGALVEKEVRVLSRSPRFRMVFLMGFTFGLLVWLPMALGRQGTSSFFLRSNYLTVISVYSLLLLSEACFWNSFGFDRSGAQIYFLAPISFSQVLIGKNLTALVFIILEIATIALVCGLLGMPMHPVGLLEAFTVALVISIFLMSAGNQLSIRQARAVNPTASFRAGAAGRLQAILFVIYPIAFLPIGLAYLARYAFNSQAAFFGVLAVDAIAGLIIYKIALDSAVQAAERMKEKMITALSRGDGPIAA